MSALLWCLAIILLLYVAGGLIFSWLERDAELAHYKRNKFLYEQMREMYELKKCHEDWFQDTEFCRKQKEFGVLLEHFFERSGNEMKDSGKWTFFGAIFYVGTLLTTVGYGSTAPVTWEGQLFTVIFSLVGMPLMGYVLAHVGSLVVNVWMPMFPDFEACETWIWRFVVVGSLNVLLLVVSGVLFVQLEGWTYLQSFYFSACSLMSVGFGDFTPSHTVSRAVALVIIMLGLGAMATFITLLQDSLLLRGENFADGIQTWYDAVVEAASPKAAQDVASPKAAPEGTTKGGLSARDRGTSVS